MEKSKVKKSWQDYGREWLDTLVVAISVAMAFRAYFFEPFNIPTGSMQPTLYGNHTQLATPAEKSVWDAPVLSFCKFLLTGTTYKEFRAPWSGDLYVAMRNDGNIDACVVNGMHGFKSSDGLFRFLGNLFLENEYDNMSGTARLPTDVLAQGQLKCTGAPRNPYALQGNVRCLGSVNKGDVIWNGQVMKGDFIFVNRWWWNFFKPARGEIMVFSTTGINDLPQGTHYIKRMTALPGETVDIRRPDVFINGSRIDPIKPMTGKAGEPTPQPNADGPGIRFCPMSLGQDEFYACGDNSDNSKDSRYWGAVPRNNLRGIASCVFWPIVNPRWGNVK